MADPQLASFDLVVATVDRTRELGRLLASLERQTHRAFRVLLVDQNGDDRLDRTLHEHGALDLVQLQARRGLARARNAAFVHVQSELVAFPDDDCVFPDDLLERVAHRFAADEGLDGVTGRTADTGGRSAPSWAREPAELTRDNLWNRASSISIFLRSRLAATVGDFDEQLGLGSGHPWSSGEEIDYLVRAVDAGARIEYDPGIVVLHEIPSLDQAVLRAVGARDGASVGYILRKHRYPASAVGRLLVRPAGGAVLAFARGDGAGAGFHLSTLRGRLRGYRGGVAA